MHIIYIYICVVPLHLSINKHSPFSCHLLVTGSIGGSALPCVFSFVLNNTPKDSVYTVLADTDAIVVKNRWDSFIRRILKEEYCMAGINPRASLGAVEWNWISFKSEAFRSKKYDYGSLVKEAYAIPDFKDWGQWWELQAQQGGW
jgi:hypothetical protein